MFFLEIHYDTLVVRSSSSCQSLPAPPSLSGCWTEREGWGAGCGEVGGSSAAACFSRWRLSVCPWVGPAERRPREGGGSRFGQAGNTQDGIAIACLQDCRRQSWVVKIRVWVVISGCLCQETIVERITDSPYHSAQFVIRIAFTTMTSDQVFEIQDIVIVSHGW